MSLLTSKAWRIGGVHLKALGIKKIMGNPANSKNTQVRGQAQVYQATISNNIILELGDTTWETNDREVQCLNCSINTPERLRRLRHGLRLGVQYLDKDTNWVELRQARIDSDQGENWSKLYQATMEDLTEGAGIPVRQVLERFGAEVDPREQLIGDDSRRRRYLCATFPKELNHLPAICYVLTRILPLTRNIVAGQ